MLKLVTHTHMQWKRKGGGGAGEWGGVMGVVSLQ